MNSEHFCYWLNGFVELNGSVPTPKQWQSIKDHLQLVFKKVTPKVDLGLFHKPMMPPAIGPNQTYIPTPLYEPRVTCSAPQNEKAWDLSSAPRYDQPCKWNGAHVFASAEEFKNRGH